MGASLTVEYSSLEELIKELDNPSIRQELESLPQKRAIAALVAQAIADNFNKEGPGWAPLSPNTIRSSVSKKLRANLDKMSDAEIKQHESSNKGTGNSFRKVLRKTGLLFNTVTVLGYSGNKNGKIGRNLYQTQGNKLVFGTDLSYAAIHNSGDSKRNIPKREFMVIRKIWMDRLEEFVSQQCQQIIDSKIGGSS